VLPHFLAIGNRGSQALVPKVEAEIVNKQAQERFKEKVDAQHEREQRRAEEARRQLQLRWKEFDSDQAEEHRRRQEVLTYVKSQGERQRAARLEERRRNFFEDNSDPNRAYPCRLGYDRKAELEQRRRWCSNLDRQVALRENLSRERAAAGVVRDRFMALQLEAAINGDRQREVRVQEQDMARLRR
ncbi:unnamed protein product, partial [Discosporangium mesarthrocarpum]